MEQKKRILLSGYYGFSNAGDEAILSALVSSLRAEMDADITVLSASPEDTSELYEVDAVQRMSLKHVLGALDNCDMLISGGGSLLQDVTSMKSLIYYLSIIKMAMMKKKKVMILGQGIGPLKKGISRYLAGRTLNKADMITVRDAHSKELLREIGVKKPEITITADPTLMLYPAHRDAVDKLLLEIGIEPDDEVLAVSLRDWGDAAGFTESLVCAFNEISAKIPAKILFLTMHLPDDVKISKECAKAVQNSAVQPQRWSAEELIGALARCRMTVGIRLHALILAASAGTPSVGIAYDPKVEQFCKSAGQVYISLHDLLNGKLADTVVQQWLNSNQSREELSKMLPDMRELARLNIYKAIEALKRS